MQVPISIVIAALCNADEFFALLDNTEAWNHFLPEGLFRNLSNEVDP